MFVQLLGPLKGTYNLNNLIVFGFFHDLAGAGWAVTVGSHHDVQAVEGNIAALAGQVIVGHVDLILWYEFVDASRIDDIEIHLGLGYGIATVVEAPHADRVDFAIIIQHNLIASATQVIELVSVLVAIGNLGRGFIEIEVL